MVTFSPETMNATNAPVIDLEGVGRVLDAGERTAGVQALEDVSLRIDEGEFVCITGPSGAGKTTLTNILGCLDRPSSGRYRLAGREVQHLDADALAWLRRRIFGFVFQDFGLVGSATALENVALPAHYAGMARTEAKARARDLLGRLGLLERADHLPVELSGGEQQRVAIARALMNGGRVLLADEPTGALDRANAEEVLSALERLAARGHTLVVASHDPDIAARADRRIELRDGRVVADTGRTSASRGCRRDVPQAVARSTDFAAGVRDAWAAGLSALRRAGGGQGRRARALLPMFSVLVSVWLGSLALGVGDGAYQRTMGRINFNGLDTIHVMPQFMVGEDHRDFKGLTLVDAEHIAGVSNVRAVSPERNLFNMTVRRGDAVADVHVRAVVDLGTKEGRGRAGGYRMESGDFITLREDENKEQVAVLGSVVRKKLFPAGVDPVGEQILLGTVPFRVKGVLRHRTEISLGPYGELYRQIEEEANNWVHVPYQTAAALLFGDDKLTGIYAFVEDVERIDDTARSIRDLGIRLHGGDFFFPEYPEMYLAHAREYGQRLLATLASIAGVALLSGNLIIVATVLTAVRARSREIGVRMAIGARRRDILRQFLGEALGLSVTGGLAGVLLASSSIPALRLLDISAAFAWWHFVLPFACAIAVAIPFAVVPARRASRLSPVEALSEC